MDRYKFSILLLRKLLLHDRYYYHHRVIDPIQFNPRLDQNLVENLEGMIRSSLVIEHSTVNRKSSLTETRLRFIERRCDESVGKYRLEDAKSGGGVVFHVARIGGGIKLVTGVSKWINKGSSARFSFFLIGEDSAIPIFNLFNRLSDSSSEFFSPKSIGVSGKGRGRDEGSRKTTKTRVEIYSSSGFQMVEEITEMNRKLGGSLVDYQ